MSTIAHKVKTQSSFVTINIRLSETANPHRRHVIVLASYKAFRAQCTKLRAQCTTPSELRVQAPCITPSEFSVQRLPSSVYKLSVQRLLSSVYVFRAQCTTSSELRVKAQCTQRLSSSVYKLSVQRLPSSVYNAFPAQCTTPSELSVQHLSSSVYNVFPAQCTTPFDATSVTGGAGCGRHDVTRATSDGVDLIPFARRSLAPGALPVRVPHRPLQLGPLRLLSRQRPLKQRTKAVYLKSFRISGIRLILQLPRQQHMIIIKLHQNNHRITAVRSGKLGQ